MKGLAIAALLLHATASPLEEGSAPFDLGKAKDTDFLDQIKEELDFADGTVLGLQRGCPLNKK